MATLTGVKTGRGQSPEDSSTAELQHFPALCGPGHHGSETASMQGLPPTKAFPQSGANELQEVHARLGTRVAPSLC